VLAHEPAIRLAAFAGALLLLVVLERAFPRRPRTLGARRWLGNLGLAACGAAAVRLAAPAAAVGAALWAEARGIGLFPALGAPSWLAFALSLLLLDLLIYWQHRATHAVPPLWRLHRVHHADPELDASSGLRFHPLEILLSMALKAAAVVAFGAPPEAVLLFEVLLNATAMFNHSNLAIPPRLERVLRWVVVTPDLHRTHHSEAPDETDSVFGFCLPWWDRLFGTWRDAPRAGHDGVVLGVPGYRAAAEQRLDRLLLQPLRPAPLSRRAARGAG
jgi:sterol desaturase/sphingolipid hydroxylase (fatty acid hydroxylase superfamily)